MSHGVLCSLFFVLGSWFLVLGSWFLVVRLVLVLMRGMAAKIQHLGRCVGKTTTQFLRRYRSGRRASCCRSERPTRPKPGSTSRQGTRRATAREDRCRDVDPGSRRRATNQNASWSSPPARLPQSGNRAGGPDHEGQICTTQPSFSPRGSGDSSGRSGC